jgi:hypothetical protein
MIKIPSNKNFGITFGFIFFIFFVYIFLKKNDVNQYLIILSFIFFILGFLNSKLLEPLNKAWQKLGLILGGIISPIFLALLYLLTVIPTGIIMKIRKKNLLDLKKENKQTYWKYKNKVNYNFKRQF